ncbi:MAG: hypothetical protein JSV85_01845 [Candidatus Bathyarchaeota archaeon]|nr:MAG: hypothetical protein JSV85_01845 [Candidatus Bathyarchaeota archaeon]
MSEEKRGRKKGVEDAEEIKEILGVVSTEVPALIKGIIGAVFSEEAGGDMGRAAGAFYKELKKSGMPDDVAVAMTENYISVFTNIGDMLKDAVGGKGRRMDIKIGNRGREESESELTKKIKEKMAEKREGE